MERLEPVSRTFQQLEKRNPSRLGPRRTLRLPLEKLRPTLRFVHRDEITGPIPERIIYDYSVLAVECSGEIQMPASTLPFPADSLVWIPPFLKHRVLFDSTLNGGLIAMHFDLAADFPPPGRRHDHRSPYEIHLQDALQLPACGPLSLRNPAMAKARKILDCWSKRSALGNLEADWILNGVILEALTQSNTLDSPSSSLSLRTQDAVLKVSRFIETRYAEPLTMEQFVRLANCSRSHLIRSFRQMRGFSLMGYLNEIRMRSARELLINPERSIKEIAHAVGFEDAFYFSRAFRTHDGLSPSEFRETFIR